MLRSADRASSKHPCQLRDLLYKPPPQEKKWAVISYVAEDVAWCEWLYYTLNGYPVPRELANHSTRHGFPVPPEITLYPDPEDAAHISDYPWMLETARFLIAILSPHSSHCPRAAEQLRAFKGNAEDDRVIVLVVDGEPEADGGKHGGLMLDDWLPSWIRWRLDDNGNFRAAEKGEPVIVDARAGHASLDDVMQALLVALYDVPKEEYDRIEAPKPRSMTRSARAAVLRPVEERVWAELSGPAKQRDRQESASRDAASDGGSRSGIRSFTLWMLTLWIWGATLAIVVLYWPATTLPKAGGSAGSSVPAASASVTESATVRESTPSSQDAIAATEQKEPAPAPEPQASEVAAAPIESHAPESASAPALIPVVNAASPSSVTQALEPGPEPVPPPSDPAAPDQTPPAPTPAQVAEAQANSLLLEIKGLRARAEQLARGDGVTEALVLYHQAIDSAQRYSTMRGAEPGMQLEAARLCLTTGALEAMHASSVEARKTLLAGQKALSKVKGGKSTASERDTLQESLRAQLRRVEGEISGR